MVTDTGPNGRLELTLTDDVAELRATAPEQRNCVSLGFVDDLFAHIDTLEARLSDGDVSAILLTHAGDVFCAGYDLDIISDDDRADERETLIERHNAGRSWLTNVDVPVVVGAKGPAVAAGAGQVQVGDIVVAGPDFRIWWSEINVGLFPYTMGPGFIEQLGLRRAAEVTFLGQEARLGPQESREIGLVNRVVADGEVDATVRELGDTLADHERRYGYLGQRESPVVHGGGVNRVLSVDHPPRMAGYSLSLHSPNIYSIN